jgi:hypothetical protein
MIFGAPREILFILFILSAEEIMAGRQRGTLANEAAARIHLRANASAGRAE